MVADAAYARCLRLAQRALRELSGRLAAAAACRAPAHRGDLRVRARRRRLRRRRRSHRRRAAARCSTTGRDRLHAAAAGIRCRGDGSDAADIFVALGRHHAPRVGSSVSALRRSAERVPAGCHRDAVRDLGRPARLLPALGQSRRAAGPAHLFGHRDAQLDALVRRRLHRAAAHELLAGSRRSTGPRAALYVPLETVRRAGRRRGATSRARRLTTAVARGARRLRRGRTRALFDAGRPIADAVSGRLRWELRATWLGGVRILDRLEAVGFDVFRARPTLGVDRTPPGDLARHTLAWATDGDAQDQLLLLVPRCCRRRSAARSRRSSISAARWTTPSISRPDQARALGRRSTLARARSRASSTGGAPETPQGTPAAAVRRAVPPAARAVRRARRRRRDGRDAAALRDVRRSRAVLPSRRLVRRPDVRRDLRLPRAGGARLRARPRRRAAAHEHPARRRRGLPARPHVPAGRGSRAVRLHRGRHQARGRRSRPRRAVGEGARACSSTRRRARASSSPARSARCRSEDRRRFVAGRDHARDLLGSAAAHRSGANATCSAASSACRGRRRRLHRAARTRTSARVDDGRRRRHRRRLCRASARRSSSPPPAGASSSSKRRRGWAGARRRSPIARPASASTTGSTCCSAATARPTRS